MKKLKFQSPTGMHDILPEDQPYYDKILETAQDIAEFYGFQKIEIPVLEKAILFGKGIGLTTDIVEKQMFVIKRDDDDLALRPEFTAGIVRAYIEHGLANWPQPVKLYSFGPVFRAETSQSGRYRQFLQFDLEAFGEKSPATDAQIILVFYNTLQELGIKNIGLYVNSIGDSQCRPYYKKLLVNFLKTKLVSLCADCRRRLRLNPFRVLDCKEEKCQRVVSQAPQLIDHLCQECHSHFKEVLEFLDELRLPYQLNPYLVRGLDYYTKTVFEIFSPAPSDTNYPTEQARLETNPLMRQEQSKTENSQANRASTDLPKQLALVGGGRFDKLVKVLGGKDTSVCGGAAGIERIANLLREKAIKFPEEKPPKIFLAQLGIAAKRKSLSLFEQFRRASIKAAESFGRDSLKAQLNKANKLGVRWTLILGQKESLEGNIIIRDMEKDQQTTVKIEKVVEEMKRRLKK